MSERDDLVAEIKAKRAFRADFLSRNREKMTELQVKLFEDRLAFWSIVFEIEHKIRELAKGRLNGGYAEVRREIAARLREVDRKAYERGLKDAEPT